MNRYAFHAPSEAVWRPCVTCELLGEPKDTVGLCHCDKAFCFKHMPAHLGTCEIAREKS